MRYIFWLVSLVVLAFPSLADACQQFNDVVQDTKGNVVSGVTATVTLAGSGGAVTLYSDELCAATTPNPVTSDSTGHVSFFVTDGEYAVTFTKTGYVFQPISRIAIYDPLGENIKTVAFYPTTDLCAAGIGAIDQIGATPITLVINKSVNCSVNKTIPLTLKIQRMGAGLITIASGAVLTWAQDSNGESAAILVDSNSQIFAGSGTIAGVRTVYARWWGTNLAALQAAIAQVDTSNSKVGTVTLAGYTELGTTTLVGRANVELVGQGRGKTTFGYTGTGIAVDLHNLSTTRLRRLDIWLNTTSATAIGLDISAPAATVSANIIDDISIFANTITAGQIGINAIAAGQCLCVNQLTNLAITSLAKPVVTANETSNTWANIVVDTWGTGASPVAVDVNSSRSTFAMFVTNPGGGVTTPVLMKQAGNENIIDLNGYSATAGTVFNLTGVRNVARAVYPNGTLTIGSVAVGNTVLDGQSNYLSALTTTAFTATLQANLGTPANGTVVYCSDCTFANPCAGAGTGAIAKRLAGAWRCD